MNQNRRRIRLLIIAAAMAAVIAAACAVYLADYYRADMTAIGAFAPEYAGMYEDADGNLVCPAENALAGLIFYPGGKVEHTAYIPLMQELSRRGIFCVLVRMPFRLAVLDIGAADGIAAQHPQIERWYIGGHSLGGSMAASYVSGRPDSYEGLILLGSYSTADLTAADIPVLSVYGSEDHVLNREKYAENRKNLPEDFEEIVIDGGCHAYFGMYGEQEGDGAPRITNAQQITITAEAAAAFMGVQGGR